MYVRQLLILAIFLIFTSGVSAKTEAEHKQFIQKLYKHALVNTPTYTLLEELCRLHPKRLSGSPGAEEAIKWAQNKMTSYEFDRSYLQDVVVPHWVRGAKEEAYIFDADGNKISLNILALGQSVATPAEGIKAGVVVVNSLDEVAALGRPGIEGKIVFYNHPFEQHHLRTFSGYSATVVQRSKGPSQAARYGALAVVIRSVSTGNDDHPHTGALFYAKDAEQIPAAALGVTSANALVRVLEANPSQELYLKINSRSYPDAHSANVIGEIRGSEKPEEIIVVGGHIDAWDTGEGAHDDGAGVTHSIMAVKLLKELGYKPKRTLRVVLFINEENGMRGAKTYAEKAVANKEKHLIAIESDAGGFTPRAFGIKASDAVLKRLQAFQPFFPAFTIESIVKGYGGPDVNALNKADGTPTCGLIPDSQRYFDYHHSPADVFSAVNQRELELGTASIASLVYLLDQFGL